MTEFSFYNPLEIADVDSVGSLLDYVLTTINSVFAQNGVDLPPRQYINVGQAAYDCEQLTVTLTQLYIGTPNESPNTPQPCDAQLTAIMTIELVRDVPTLHTTGSRMQAPSPSELSQAARNFARDGWLLLDSAKALGFPGIIADLSYSAESGAMGASIMTLVTTVL